MTTEFLSRPLTSTRCGGGDGQLDRFQPHELLSAGSSLKFCLVAEGLADLYPRLGPASLWDAGAAQCVVEQAGGAVIRLDGSPLGYGNPAERAQPFFIVHGVSDADWVQVSI